MKIVGIAGSLRAGSLNRALLKVAGNLVPEQHTFETIEIADIPLYNGDVNDAGIPAAVTKVSELIGAADAVILASPEYNYSVPGVLKNAIDWLSRTDPQPFNGKAVAIMGASPSNLGTARAQYHLRQILVYLNAFVVNKPEIQIGGAFSKFDDAGNLTDVKEKEYVGRQVRALCDLAVKLR
jgi:chromate reductase